MAAARSPGSAPTGTDLMTTGLAPKPPKQVSHRICGFCEAGWGQAPGRCYDQHGRCKGTYYGAVPVLSPGLRKIQLPVEAQPASPLIDWQIVLPLLLMPWVATQGISSHWIRHTTLTWVQGRGVASDATFRVRREAGAVRAADSVPPRPQPVMDEKVQVRQVHEVEVAASESMCHRVLLHRKTARCSRGNLKEAATRAGAASRRLAS